MRTGEDAVAVMQGHRSHLRVPMVTIAFQWASRCISDEEMKKRRLNNAEVTIIIIGSKSDWFSIVR